MDNSTNAYALRIDGPLLRRQRQWLLELSNTVAKDDQDVLEGALLLSWTKFPIKPTIGTASTACWIPRVKGIPTSNFDIIDLCLANEPFKGEFGVAEKRLEDDLVVMLVFLGLVNFVV